MPAGLPKVGCSAGADGASAGTGMTTSPSGGVVAVFFGFLPPPIGAKGSLIGVDTEHVGNLQRSLALFDLE